MSCSNDRQDELLDRAESLMEEYPDSSLMFLEEVGKTNLKSQSQQARYSLLRSIALDKNHIDTTTFDVIQPAVDYYMKRGSFDEKGKTYYYQGRIYQNRRDFEKALSSYENALTYLQQCKDSMMLVRTLVAQAYLYYELYDIESYIASNQRAADISNKILQREYEFSCILNALNGAIITDNKYLADNLIARCRGLGLNEAQNEELSWRMLLYNVKFDKVNELDSLLSHTLKLPAPEISKALDLALAYNKLGDNSRAIIILDSIGGQYEDFDTLKYQSIYVSILKDKGDYKTALSVYENFSQRLDILNSRKFDQKAQSIIETYQQEIRNRNELRDKTRTIWGCIGGIVILVMSVFMLIMFIRNNNVKRHLALQKAKAAELENNKLKSESEYFALEIKSLQLERAKKALEAENLAHRVEILENEIENLRRIISETNEELPSEVRNAIQERIGMLNSLLAGYITSNKKYDESYESWVKNHTDNVEDFMNSTRMAFCVTHPRFIQYFEEHGLTLSEINYVCLYAIGLKGKEVGNYIKKRGHVNISSDVRKKLGLDRHETNLGIFVRKLLKKL